MIDEDAAPRENSSIWYVEIKGLELLQRSDADVIFLVNGNTAFITRCAPIGQQFCDVILHIVFTWLANYSGLLLQA